MFFIINGELYKVSFLESSLDSLVKDMKERKPNAEFHILKQSIICKNDDGNFSSSKYEILKNGKSSLPYEKLTIQYLMETCKVPPREDYWSDLKNEGIDDVTYQDICQFWTTFNCANLGNSDINQNALTS